MSERTKVRKSGSRRAVRECTSAMERARPTCVPSCGVRRRPRPVGGLALTGCRSGSRAWPPTWAPPGTRRSDVEQVWPTSWATCRSSRRRPTRDADRRSDIVRRWIWPARPSTRSRPQRGAARSTWPVATSQIAQALQAADAAARVSAARRAVNTLFAQVCLRPVTSASDRRATPGCTTSTTRLPGSRRHPGGQACAAVPAAAGSEQQQRRGCSRAQHRARATRSSRSGRPAVRRGQPALPAVQLSLLTCR